jgi:esterase/lipase
MQGNKHDLKSTFQSQKKKWLIIVSSVVGIILLAYEMGPKPHKPDFSKLHLTYYSPDLHHLEDSLNMAETSLLIKPDNQARIVWEKPYEKTAYSMVYLHGNGASQEEGDPIHEALAHRYGCNLFLSRLYEHGLKGDEPMLKINALDWMQSALDAIEVGHAIGEKVIVVSCSTGGTLDLFLASKYPDLVECHVMMSPNIDLFDPRSSLLSGPWGLQIARSIIGSDYYGWQAPEKAQQYWYTRYRIEGLVQLKSMIDASMKKVNFSKLDDPVIMLYYYQDEDNQDKNVSVKRMIEMYDQIATPADQKRKIQLTDSNTHIISSSIFNQHLNSVWIPITSFLEEVIHLTPIHETDWKVYVDQ